MSRGQARTVHLRYFLVFLFGITLGMVIMMMGSTAFTSAGRFPYHLSGHLLQETSVVSTVTVPRKYMSHLKSSANKNKGDNEEKKSVAISLSAAKANVSKRVLVVNKRKTPLHSHLSLVIPKGKPVNSVVRRHNPVYSSYQAKWPPAINWPPTWTRDADEINGTSSEDYRRSIVCDMLNITKSIRPTLPAHFEIRRFSVLPTRYRHISDPVSAPYCGISGLLSPWRLFKQRQTDDEDQRKIWMLFIVKSGPGYKDNRMVVRNTWGSPEIFSKRRFFVLFVVGQTNDEELAKSLQDESQTHGDILQCDFLDHYHKLPTKVLSAFRWILERDFDIEYFTMTDDDCLVNLPNLDEFFKTRVEPQSDRYKNVYCGFQHHNDAPPIRWKSKWTITTEQYSEKFYPTFCHGGLWTLARPLLHGIYCVSEITEIGDFFLEDVLLTGILREKLNFKETNIKRVVGATTKRENLMMFHAGKKPITKSKREKMMDEWKIWQAHWKNSTKVVRG